MFPKKNRYSFKGGLPKKIISFPSFSVRYGRNDLGRLQVAVVVSKKVDNRATVRNKIKRRILDSIQKNISLAEPFSLVFYVKKRALNSEDLEKETESVFNKITI